MTSALCRVAYFQLTIYMHQYRKGGVFMCNGNNGCLQQCDIRSCCLKHVPLPSMKLVILFDTSADTAVLYIKPEGVCLAL